MAKITIDGTEYETDDLSDEIKRQVQNISYCDRKLEELKNDTAVLQTARNAYARSLTEMLASSAEKAS